MKRKFKIMNHQIEQLKEEITAKDQALVKEHFDHKKVRHCRTCTLGRASYKCAGVFVGCHSLGTMRRCGATSGGRVGGPCCPVQVEKEKDILKNEGNALKDKLNEADQTRITQVCLR